MDDKQEFNYLQKLWFTQIGKTHIMPITEPLVQCKDKSNESKCPICIGDIINKKATKCNHSFCESCIDKWLETNTTCPSCRAILIISPTNQSEIDDVLRFDTFIGGGGLMQLVNNGAQDQYITIIDETMPIVSIREQKKHSVSRNATARRNIMVQKNIKPRKYR